MRRTNTNANAEPIGTEPIGTEPIEAEPIEAEPIGTEPIEAKTVARGVFRRFWNRFFLLMFPPKCVGCGMLMDVWSVKSDTALCPRCLRLWESEKRETCGVCAEQIGKCRCMPKEAEDAKCKGFFKSVYYISGKTAPVQNRLIWFIKQHRNSRVNRFLASELSPAVDRVREEVPDADLLLTYVPRSRSGISRYGCDQAKELARALSAMCGIPIRTLLVCLRNGKAQKGLTAVQRKRNAKNRYAVRGESSLSGKTILLVDDVVTTGSTVAACIRCLLRAGAQSVFVLAPAADSANRERIFTGKK